METMELTAKELLFVAAQLGAENFFGLPDPFFGMDEDEIGRELCSIQLTLVEKGHASIGFDSAFDLLPAAAELVSICSGCDRCILTDLLFRGDAQKSLRFYLCGERAAQLIVGGEQLTLCQIDPAEIAKRICEAMDWHEQEESGAEENRLLSFLVLSEAQRMAQRDPERAAALLRQEGCSDRMVKILLEGFQKKADYHTVSVADLQDRSLDHLVCIRAAAGSVRISPLYDEAESWKISSFGVQGLQTALHSFCEIKSRAEGGVEKQ